jgi:AcrR family transcriptional regulator
LTLREENKSKKLLRIHAAARELFSTRGFDDTSTRDIAEAARVGLATLFLYASDKRDLLFLACNDDLEELTKRAFAKVDVTASLIDQLCGAFRHFYVLYGQNRTLCRDLLRELTFYTAGKQSERFQSTRAATVGHIRHVISDARQRGAVTSAVDDAVIAQAIFYLFAAEVRRWLGSKETSVDHGLAQLRTLFLLLIDGIGPGAAARSGRKRPAARAKLPPGNS